MDLSNIKYEIEQLKSKILQAEKAYYVDSKPIITDSEFDKLYNRLVELEKKYPEFRDKNSPTQRIGSDIDNNFPERAHNVPILSLDKCYNEGELLNWIKKNIEKTDEKKISVTIEPKIDGASVVLYYENGELSYALTRGNGFIGNEITNNIKTIKTIPLKVDYKDNFAVRGEVYINKNDFDLFNKKYADGNYSNPRNLASGALRRLKSKETAAFPLNIFVYEGFFNKKISTHIEALFLLKELGFPINPFIGCFSNNNESSININFKNVIYGTFSDIITYIDTMRKKRKELEYEIDGLVIKINELKVREMLGFTSHHPRWAIAFKFDPPLVETKIKSIDIQVGRAGKITPVANLEPVELSGSIISRATLHNQEYINQLGVNVNDIVTISKRGDVIPAVEEVVEKGEESTPFKLPDKCPSCNSNLIEDGAHIFCKNDKCPARLLGTLQFFVSRDQMNIESLGDKTLEFLFEKGFIRYIPDIYEFNYDRLLEFEGFKEKRVENIKRSVELSKSRDFKTVLSSLGLKDIGQKVSSLLVENFKSIDRIIELAKKNKIDEFKKIYGIGEEIALSITRQLSDEENIKIIEKLKANGLNFHYTETEKISESDFLKGSKWVITGSFENFKPREKARDLIIENGGEVTETISSKTTHLLCGENPGSKLDKAKLLGIKIITENEFLKILNNKSF